ncbi:RagB/SusD family nutrient uptake outer membrane protein [Flavihumibacter rivuli]|uniref:RagB/SusD family nutrient uptake outer membrane protein n=1 Tax=Flavihumibacter rivuli TaxID=2838156 RepID=UPI001BDF2DC0|nr:RagB/SusD family nutrient uptake outer membrane protein [Flavihumibacter rivuli]ULQ56018.1 RagB/SusD family nutrient uptake outer membrane protein [Flavihumibacter rivuli]
MSRIKNSIRAMLMALPLLMLLSGCSDFLDRKPLTATLDDLNQGGLEGQVYGLYGAIRNGDVAGQAFGGIPWLAMHGFRADDSEKGSSPADGADWGVIFDQFQYAKDHWAPTIYWDQHYVLIGQANTALQLADSLGLVDEASKKNIGEARFFRAFAYFDLVRTFGQVPKIDFRVYSPADSKVPKSPESEIYALIDADLDSAIAYLPEEWPEKFRGRLTRAAAKALAAKTHLFRAGTNPGHYGTALNLCREVIANPRYGLVEPFKNIWLEAGENSKESIFEIQATIGANGTDSYTSWYAVAQGVRGSGEWDLGWGWNTPTQSLVDFYNSFDSNDPRRKATILYSGEQDDFGKTLPQYPSIPRKYWNKKVYPEPSMQTYTANRQGGWINQRIIRYADVLLMGAEAATQVGGAQNIADAVNWVNMVRRRARNSGSVSTALPDVTYVDKDQFIKVIQNERRAELAMEGERFFDLVRWGLAEQVLGPLGYQPKNKYYPIPQAAIDFSGGVLIQNPDY